MKLSKSVIGLAAACCLAALWPASAWAADSAAGKAVYDAKCKACHGTDGAGKSNIAKAMKVEMKPLGATTADVKKVITEGTGKMKPVTSVTGADLDNVVAYVHSLKK